MRAIGAAAVCAVLAAARGAAADVTAVRLDAAPGACPTDELRARVVALLGGADPFDPQARAAVRITTDADPRGVTGRVTVIDADGAIHGPREVRADACESLDDAMAIVVVVALTDAASPPAPPPAAPIAIARSIAGDGVAAVAVVAPSSRTSAAFSLGTALGRAGARWTEGLAVGARAERARASLAVELDLRAPDRIALGGVMDVEVRAISFDVVPCVHRGRAVACAIARIGWLAGRADGLAEEQARSRPILGGGARAGVEWPIGGGVAATASAELVGLATATRFLVDDRAVWTSARLDAAVAIGVVAHIP